MEDLLLNYPEGAEIKSLICFVTLVVRLLDPVLFLMLRSEIMSCQISLHQQWVG